MIFILASLGLLWLATVAGATATTLRRFSWLLLRGRMIPVPLAWLGVVASVLLVVGLPVQLSGFFAGGPVFDLMWLPMAVFELVLGPWLLMKGVNTDRGATSEPRPTIGATT